MSTSWLDVIAERVIDRNLKESEPFQLIYQSNYELWKKAVYLDSSRIAAKHNLAILEHETSDLVARGEFDQSVRNFTRRCHILHTELRPYNTTGGIIVESDLNLSRVIYDQKKTIAKKDEELKVAKTQLSELYSTFAKYEEDHQSEVKRIVDLEGQVSNLESALADKEKLIESLLAENKHLTERIVSEKNKSASQIDEMNQLLSRGSSIK